MNYAKLTDCDKIKKTYVKYYNELEYGIDGYYERTILNGESYSLYDGDKVVGLFTVYDYRGLTGFYIYKEYKMKYKDYLLYVLSLPFVNKVLFTDKDVLLHNSLKELGLKIELQAYNYRVDKDITTNFHMEIPSLSKVDELEKLFGDFITGYKDRVQEGNLFVSYDENTPICMGVIEPMMLNPNRASVAMIVNESYRQQGYGTKTIRFLIQKLQGRGMEVNSRCWYKNTNSRKTLLKSGLVDNNLLLRIEDVKKT